GGRSAVAAAVREGCARQASASDRRRSGCARPAAGRGCSRLRARARGGWSPALSSQPTPLLEARGPKAEPEKDRAGGEVSEDHLRLGLAQYVLAAFHRLEQDPLHHL